MVLHSQLLSDTVRFAVDQNVLVINSAADPFVVKAAQQLRGGQIRLAEDNIAALPAGTDTVVADASCPQAVDRLPHPYRHVPFHAYVLCEPRATIDVAVMNMLYQPSNAWMVYGLQVAE